LHRVLATDSLARSHDDWKVAPSASDAPSRVRGQVADADSTTDTTQRAVTNRNTYEPRCDVRGNRWRPKIRSATKPDVRCCFGESVGSARSLEPASRMPTCWSKLLLLGMTASRAPQAEHPRACERFDPKISTPGPGTVPSAAAFWPPCSKVSPARRLDRTHRTARPRTNRTQPEWASACLPVDETGLTSTHRSERIPALGGHTKHESGKPTSGRYSPRESVVERRGLDDGRPDALLGFRLSRDFALDAVESSSWFQPSRASRYCWPEGHRYHCSTRYPAARLAWLFRACRPS
jgi:hypothetical protein